MTQPNPTKDTEWLDLILEDLWSGAVLEFVAKTQGTETDKDYGDRVFQEAKAAILTHLQKKIVKGRIDELGHVQLIYGHQEAQTNADGEWISLRKRIKELRENQHE